MKQVVVTDPDECRGCLSCISACPSAGANISYICGEKAGILIDAAKCIICGACIKACPYNARDYIDDTALFFDDLNKGIPIALIVAPAFITSFPNWKAILAWLRALGVILVIDVSLGMEICTWAHLKYIERHDGSALIVQPCPPIASYIEKRFPDLFKKLSPVCSPILCASIYLKKVLKLPGKIAALTPCPAKSYEFSKSDSISYNVTFKKLADCLPGRGASLPEADFEFDDVAVAKAGAHILPRLRLESAMSSIGCISFKSFKEDIDIKSSAGSIYAYLASGLKEGPGSRPVLIDALNCPGGCKNGPGGNICNPIVIHNTHKEIEDLTEEDSKQAGLFSVFDDILQLADYTNPISVDDI